MRRYVPRMEPRRDVWDAWRDTYWPRNPVCGILPHPLRRNRGARRETMLIVVAQYVVSEGHDSTVARLLRKNAQASRAEPGCLEFSVYQEIDDPRAFLLYERYTSEDAFQAHRRTPHFEDIIEQQVVPLPGRACLDPCRTAARLTSPNAPSGETRRRGKVRKAEVKAALSQWLLLDYGRHALTLAAWLAALKALSLPGERGS